MSTLKRSMGSILAARAAGVFLALLLAAVPLRALPGEESEETEPQVHTPAAAAQARTPGEGFKFGLWEAHSEIEFGVRWVGQGGNRDMYRSMINLGEGMKLFRSNISLRSEYGSGALFDRLDFSMNSWGGDPYNTMRLQVSRMDAYELRVDYRNLNYFNFVPTYANPLLESGRRFGQHSVNTTQRTTDIELRLFPGARVVPFFGYTRTNSFGPGFTTFGVTGAEFLLDTEWRYGSDEYRGGVEINLPTLHLTLEQGYRFLRNDSSVARDTRSTGNFPRTFLGQPIVLDNLARSYRDRTKLPVSKVLAKFTPFRTLNVTGRYIYSMGDFESDFFQQQRGSFVSLEDFLFYKNSNEFFRTFSKRPSHTAGFVVDYSPFSRLTLINNFESRSYHISGTALLSTTYRDFQLIGVLPDGRPSLTVSRFRDNVFAYDQTRNQIEGEVDLGQGFSVRAGHRYTFIEATIEEGDGTARLGETRDMTQHTAIIGVGYRPGAWLRLSLDYENNDTDQVLTRTSPLDYDQFRFDWTVRPWRSLSATGRVAFLRNSNDQTDLDYESHNRNYTVAITYEPAERFYVSADYSRSNIFSNIAILLPQSFASDRSLFDERSDAVGGSLGVDIYRGTRVEMGYRAIMNAGDFPLNYRQPFASLSIPLSNRVAWKTYYQYYGYNEKASGLQDHRSHLVTFSLAVAY